MANPKHFRQIKLGVESWNRWRELDRDASIDLSRADLSGIDLEGADLDNANLFAADLRRTNLKRASFVRSNLSSAFLADANLEEANLNQTILDQADMSGTSCFNSRFTMASLRNTTLQGANLRQASLMEVDLTGADLDKADLSFSFLLRARLINTYIGNANFYSATVGWTKFVDIDLSDAQNLESILHQGPSNIDLDTIYDLQEISLDGENFLKGCGVPHELLAYIKSMNQNPIEFCSCFISYSHQDEDFAQRLHERMTAAKIRVWYAPEDMKGGEKLHEQIDHAIQIHEKLLLVLSEHSLKSEWVMTEIRKARKTELKTKVRKLFPIRLVDYELIRDWSCFDSDTGKDLAIEVREYFIPDFRDWLDESSFELAFTKLLQDLQLQTTSKQL